MCTVAGTSRIQADTYANGLPSPAAGQSASKRSGPLRVYFRSGGGAGGGTDSVFICSERQAEEGKSRLRANVPVFFLNATCYQLNCKSLNALIRSPAFVTGPQVTTCHRCIRIRITRRHNGGENRTLSAVCLTQPFAAGRYKA